ncbi:MAG: enoyl-CoA hydratase/isomerase family protein [Alphaproteobacteria bacterium]|nr:enoyl-CoA hydratase/isomerase family protein [Alphaproteobacteria bacterium]
MSEESVVATREGRIGRLLLNRPKALNALDLGMIRALATALAGWRDDRAVEAVVIDSASDRAFCAGGDIRAIRTHALAREYDAVETFFAEEYALNGAIAAYPKPYIALVDGICMGGGIGVSVHGRVRVATEHAVFAMPETAIAMFPDIGATYVLPRLSDMLGMFLGLTGTRMIGADAVHAGLATHFVPRADLPALRTALTERGEAAVAGAALAGNALPPFSLAPHLPAIARCFGAPSLPEILERLAAEDSDWARETLATLRSMSPSALCWSFAVIRRGAGLSLPEALAAELRITRHVTRHPDFAEGVRAMVVDKDRQPRWMPPTVEAVDPAAIAAMLD